MKIRHTLWDDENRDHVLFEGAVHPDREIYEEDVDEVLLQSPHQHVVMDEYEMNGEARVDVVGKTTFERLLFVVFAPKPFAAGRPISAREVTKSEADLYTASLK